MRWNIEVFHNIPESGCRAEWAQLRAAERLVRLLSVYRIPSWRVLWLPILNRAPPDLEPVLVPTDMETTMLDRLIPDPTRVFRTPGTLSLYRQAQIYACLGLELPRATLADGMGKPSSHLGPVLDCLAADLERSGKLGVDETTVRVLDPGRGKTKTRYMWMIVRDEWPWSGADLPGTARRRHRMGRHRQFALPVLGPHQLARIAFAIVARVAPGRIILLAALVRAANPTAPCQPARSVRTEVTCVWAWGRALAACQEQAGL